MTTVTLPRLPTRRNDWRLMARTARLVLGGPGYALVAVVAGVAALSLFVASQNLGLLGAVVFGGSLPLSARVVIVAELYPFVGTDFTPAAGLVLVLTAALIGVNVAMTTYHLREHRVSITRGGGSLWGVILGTLGAGCAACGSAVLVALLSLVGVTGSLTVLPLEGLEFALLALVAVLLSTYWLAEGMRGGEIRGCPVDLDQ